MSDKQLEAFFKSYTDADEELGFHMASETSKFEVSVVPTGSLLLDEALSSGGLPCGRLIQFYGSGGSGKTLMAMLGIRNAQAIDPTARQVFIDAEGTFDSTWAQTLGCDISKIIIIKDDKAVNGRKCFELLLGVPKEDAKHILKGKSKDGLLDKIIKKELNINFIVLDSLGAIIPPGEDVSAVGKANISLMARFLSTTLKKLSLEVNKAKVPFVIINHKRDSMDMYGPDHTYSGGNSYTHFLSANIYFEAVARKDAQILDEKENKIGHTIRATIEKSKFGPHPRKCEFKVNFGIGVIDIHEEIGTLALEYGIVNKPTSVTHEYKGQKWVGEGKYFDAIKNDQSLATELREAIAYARANKKNKAPPAPVIEETSEDDELLSELVEEEKSRKKK